MAGHSLNRRWIRSLRIDLVLLERFGHLLHRDLLFIGQRLKCRNRHVIPIDFKKRAQFASGIAAAITVRAQDAVISMDERSFRS
jgi:hypothetical protein